MDCNKNGIQFAEKFSKFATAGSYYFESKDMPNLIKKYVKGNRALDYGCGQGRATKFLRSLGMDAEGVDVNSAMIEIAKQKDPKGKYQTIESGKIPSPDNEYDFVYCAYVTGYVTSKNELIKISKEINRVLKPRGVFIVITHPKEYFNGNFSGINTEFEENKNLRSGSQVKLLFKEVDLCVTNYFWTEEDYEEMLQLSGMKILEKYRAIDKKSDECDGKSERLLSPPMIIYVAQKTN